MLQMRIEAQTPYLSFVDARERVHYYIQFWLLWEVLYENRHTQFAVEKKTRPQKGGALTIYKMEECAITNEFKTCVDAYFLPK